MLGVGWAVCLLASVAIGLLANEHVGVALAVICIGLGCLLAVVLGKPAFAVDLLDRLQLRLPDSAYRTVVGCMGLGVIALGLWGLVRAQK